MADSKRWTVTYTKHVKQKRKVYQDGFLQLQVSSGKASLYDECEKLLVCRVLKKEENVTSGETLEFGSYLVDIGDLEGGNKPGSDLNVERKLKNVSRFKTPSGVKMNAKENTAQARKPLSPSQKVIKDFKKRELLKYASPKISQETTKPTPSEWQVLYTNQMTQKAKKYHDGFLRLVSSGSQGAQVRLFDASGNLLDSRFLKKADIIKPGESVAFGTYLVDIGEVQGCLKLDSSVQGKSRNNVERMEKIDRQQISLDTDNHVTVGKCEWQVLYTTQLTQKAKKYHDGFLQLEICGSLGRQVVLYDLSKRPLERRFLKKDEVITVGESIYFVGHLVDVGEPEGSHQSPVKFNEQGAGDKVVERRQLRHGQKGFHKVDVREPEGSHKSPVKFNERGTGDNVVERKLLRHGQNGCQEVYPSAAKGQPPSRPCLRQDAGLNSEFANIGEIKLNKTVPLLRPLRDASQILSILQGPKPHESYVTGGRSPNGPCQNMLDTESSKTMNSLDTASTEAACRGGSFQFTENAKMSDQSYSDKQAQANMGETDFDLLISSSSGDSCLISNEAKSAEEFSDEREAFPSFDLGF